MPLWQRLLILLAAVVGVSVIVDLICHSLFGFYLPSYASGIVGGLCAVGIWDLLKKTKTRQK